MKQLKHYVQLVGACAGISVASLLASCAGKGVPDDLRAQCLRLYGGDQAEFPVGRMIDAIEERLGQRVSYAESGPGQHAVRVRWNDALSGKSRTFGLLLVDVPSAYVIKPQCQGRSQAPQQIQIDDETLGGRDAVLLLQSWAIDWVQRHPEFQNAVTATAPAAPEPAGPCPPGAYADGNSAKLRCLAAGDKEVAATAKKLVLRSPTNNGVLKLTLVDDRLWEFDIAAVSGEGASAHDGGSSGKIGLTDNRGSSADEGGCKLSFERRSDREWHVEQLTPECGGLNVSLTGDYRG